MSGSLVSGARFLFELIETHGISAEYRVTILVTDPHGEVVSKATLRADGGVELAPLAEAPDWANAMARSLLLTLCADYRDRGAWPRRVQRWRGPT